MDTLIRSELNDCFTNDNLSITYLEAACERVTQAGRFLERQGLLVTEAEQSYLALDASCHAR